MQKVKEIIMYSLIAIVFVAVGNVGNKEIRYESEYEKVIVNPPEADNSSNGYKKPELKSGTLININTATAQELTALKGVGEKISKRIIDYREVNGNFEVIEDIMKVTGIGEKKFLDIKEYITVE